MANILDSISGLFSTVAEKAAKNITVGVNSNGKIIVTSSNPTQTAIQSSNAVITSQGISAAQAAQSGQAAAGVSKGIDKTILIGGGIAAALILIALIMRK